PDSAPDLSIEVFDPDGLPVGSDEDSAPDGRNALFTFTADQSGSYQVVVWSAGDLHGDYVLSVTGTTGAPAVFRVTQSDPGDGVPLPVYPGSYTVELSEQALLTSVDSSDLTVDGAPAEWVQFVDGDTLEFGIGNANLGIEHIYDVQIAAGAISSLSGKPLDAYSAAFSIDKTPPRVTSISVAGGDVVGADPMTVTVEFSEAMDRSTLGLTDVGIEDQDGVLFAPASLDWNGEGTQLAIGVPALAEGAYRLTLFSRADAFRDRATLLLDGEPGALPSGDGLEGGDFFVDFVVDHQHPVSYPVPLVAVQPGGSLIYDPAPAGMFHQEGDSDDYTLALEAGQVLTLVLASDDPRLRPAVSLIDLNGADVLGFAGAPVSGGSAILQTVRIEASGIYTLRASADHGVGAYRLQALVNASQEEERKAGFGETRADAQSIDGSFIALAGAASRGAVRGELGGAGSRVVYVDAQANVFSAGLAGAFEGLEPAVLDFTAGAGNVFTFPDVSGLVSAGGTDLTVAPDGGGDFSGTTDLLSSPANPGISGIVYGRGDLTTDPQTLPHVPGKTMFLTGVFLADGLPAVAPERLDFTDAPDGMGADFTDLTPALGQTFYIGNGRTSGGVLQNFHAPAGATRLFLGFADGLQFGFPQSEPGQYGDNYGVLDAQVQLNAEEVSDEDWYSFNLDAHQPATITLSRDEGAGEVELEIYDASGNLLASGAAGAANVEQYIQDFRSTLPATFYLRVGGAAGAYSLLVTRGATFDLNLPGEVQDISETFMVLGETAGQGNAAGFAYLNSTVGHPWGSGTNPTAMNAAFPGGWDDLRFETVDVENLLDTHAFIFLDGSDDGADELEAFLSANLPALEAWVARGNSLFLNAAPNEGDGMSFGFGGVELRYSDSSGTGTIVDLDHPIFQGPALPVVATYTGSSFTHASVSGGGITPLINDNTGDAALAELSWGAGTVLFGGMTTTNYHGPQPQATNLRVNILSYGASAVARGDTYSFLANAGDPLVIETTTPGDAPGEPVNALDPVLHLYDPDGNEIAADQNGAADGRNARIEIPAPVSGRYTVAVGSENAGGAYLLSVAGSTLSLDTTPPTVASSSLDDGDIVPPGDLTYTATFSEELASAGIDFNHVVLTNTDTGERVPFAPSGLLGEYYSLGYSLSSLSEVDFDAPPTYTRIDPLVDMGDSTGMNGLGLYDHYAARWTGSIRIDTAGTYTFYTTSDDGSRLTIDGVPVVNNDGIHGTSEASGAISLSAGYHELKLEFFENAGGAYIGLSWMPPGGSKTLIPTGVLFASGATDVNLLSYDPLSSTLTANFNDLVEGNYSLALVSGATGLRDLQGNRLDGNADGAGGDDFTVDFRVDTVAATPLSPLEPVAPRGSLVYDPPFGGHLFGTGDSDDYTVSLDGGQKVSIRVTPEDPSLRPTLELIAPDGTSVLGSAAAGAAGDTALLLDAPAGLAGTYTVRVGSLEGSGSYVAQALLNAQFESEEWGGPSNDASAGAQNADASSIALAGAADRLAAVGHLAGGDDWYSFSLAAWQAASVVATRTDAPGAGDLVMRLYDAALALLATGVADAGNVDQSISDFIAGAAGTFYVRLSSASALPYSVVVTRSAGFGLETGSRVQDISPTGQVLGALGTDGNGSSNAGGIRVAILDGGNSGQVASQLNDDSYFNFTASLVSAAAIDTLAELSSYDVVVIGDQSSRAGLQAIASVLRQWVEAGGGVVGTGWLAYAAGVETGTPIADINAIMPVDTSSRTWNYSAVLDINDTPHALTQGIADVTVPYYTELPANGVDALGAQVLATSSGYAAVVAGGAGAGRSVYLGPVYTDSPGGFASGTLDRLLEQALAWAAIDRGDSYTFQAVAGQPLDIRTFTPGDGPGEPLNTLDPRIELYGPEGEAGAIYSDDNGAADGRNARLALAAPATGTYEVRIIAAAGAGDYILQAGGAALAEGPAPFVQSTSTPQGANLIAPPSELTLTLSEALLSPTVEATDLVLDNGASATAVEFIDGRTLRFTLDITNTEGTFHYSLAPGVVQDLQGAGNTAFDGVFHVDHTGPRVVSQAPAASTDAPFNHIDLVFSEELDPASASTADIAAFTGPGGADLLAQITGVAVTGNTLRVNFTNRYAEGDYVLTLSPALTDRVGNPMDQDENGAGGEPGDAYEAQVLVRSVDLIEPLVTAPGTANWGETLTIDWTGRNNLSAPANANWHDYVYLSSDATLDGGDTALNWRYPGVNPLAGHTDYATSVDVTLPLNHGLVDGTYYFLVKADHGNAQAEADEGNNVGASGPVAISFGARPDLVVTGLDVVATPAMESGASVTVNWTDTNAGDGPMDGYFYDRVNVFNVTTGTNLGNYDYLYDGRPLGAAIGAGAGVPRSATIALPDGPSAVGELRFTVTSDAHGHVFERTTGGASGEGNNSASVTHSATLASYPDLRVQNLAVTPDSPESGQVIHIAWEDVNLGTEVTGSNFYDRIRVVNTSTGATLLDDWQLYNGAAIGVGEAAARSRDLRLPDGPAGVGTIQVTITTDINHNVYEYLVGLDAEANNSASASVASPLAMYPDLQVENLMVTPGVLQSGNAVTLDWTDRNTGNLASGAYNNLVTVQNTGTGEWLVYQAVAAGAVDAGGSQARSFGFTLPDGDRGVGHLAIGISNDWNNAVFEYNAAGTGETNNSASASADSSIAPYADLVVQGLNVTPAGLTSGGTMTIAWNDYNNGTLSAAASWNDRVLVVNTTTGATLLNHTVHHAAADGALGAGSSLARSYSFTLPNGDAGAGELSVTVTSDWGNNQYEYNAGGTGESNNSASTTATSTVAPYADLVVQDLAVLPAMPHSGDMLTLNWKVANQGAAAATASFYDYVRVRNIDTGEWLFSHTVYHDAALEGGIAAGGMLDRSASFALPHGARGIGQLEVTVSTDWYGQQYEYNAGGTAETNNTATALVDSTAADYADLQIEKLHVEQEPPVSGGLLTIRWDDRNSGNKAAGGSYYDRVYVTNAGGQVLANTWVQVSGPVAPGAALAREYSFTLPDGSAGAGELSIQIYADIGNALFEYNAAGTGETNNSADLVVASELADYPNLTVTAIQAPASAPAGSTVQVSWTTHNAGSATAAGGWSEQVFLSADDAVGGDLLLATFYYAGNSIAPAASVNRTENVVLPAFTGGAYKVVVRVDAGNAVFEMLENDNAVLDDANLVVDPALQLMLSTPAVGEQAGNAALTGTVVRNGAATGALTVYLSSTHGDLLLPSSIEIADGQSSASFTIGVTDNTLVDGNRDGSVTAAATGFAGGTAALRILDNDSPRLTLSASPTTLPESFGPLTVTVTRNTDPAAELNVQLDNGLPYKLTLPANVVIPAGAASATFEATPVNDTIAEGNRGVNVTASASGFASGGVHLEIQDDDVPVLTLDLATSVISEGAGAAATHGTVTRSLVTDSPVSVALFGDINRLRVPNFVLIPAGAASVDFSITIQDNSDADGDHVVPIFADVADAFTLISLPGPRVQKDLLITDDDGPTLTVTIDKSVIGESAGPNAATGTVTRNTPPTEDLTVFLSSTDTTEATVPESVVIPAGETQASFAVAAVNDGVQDGTQNVTLVASAGGYNAGSVAIQVTDRQIADLRVSDIALPASATTGSEVDFAYTVLNDGLGAATGSWSDTVFLSGDNILSGDDQLLSAGAGTTPLGAGVSYSRSASFQLGNHVGQVWVFVVSDAGSNVTEISESNNTRAVPLTVNPSYRALVSTDVERAPGGTVIPMAGHAYDVDSGAPKAFALVTIEVMKGGTVRTIDVLTDDLGQFTAEFTPLPGEAGHYTISADHPGVTDRSAQDAFDLLGMKALGGIVANLLPGETRTGQFEIQNLSPIELTNLTASVAGLPAGITLAFTAPALLPGSGTAFIEYSISAAADMAQLNGNAPILIGSAEGVTTSATLALTVTPLRPNLVANPGYLAGGMLRGGQSLVSFDVTNTGGAATGPMQVQLPANTPWLSLASGANLPSL
ncbi:MAG: Ig-like domain-containing protein, partial [Burkholderiales bacterium]|nr:Ig-like domain-containing protein [Burkholderiales bacterium]